MGRYLPIYLCGINQLFIIASLLVLIWMNMWLFDFQLSDPVTALVGYGVNSNGHFQLFANACFTRIFTDLNDINSKLRQYGAHPILLWSR